MEAFVARVPPLKAYCTPPTASNLPLAPDVSASLSVRRSRGSAAFRTRPVVLTCHLQVIHLGVPEMRQYWAHLLRNCIDKYAQEHPLYALFSSILSTLAKVTCAADSNASPTTAGGTFIFSYPQCRVVNKTMVGGDEYAPMSVYPDFGLLRSTMTQLSNGDIVQLEQIKLLVEVKRLYRGDEGT